jgi:hypothetical protein
MLELVPCTMIASVMVELDLCGCKMDLGDSQWSEESPGYLIELVCIDVLILYNESRVVVKDLKEDDSSGLKELRQRNINHKLFVPLSNILCSDSEVVRLSGEWQVVVHIVFTVLFGVVEVTRGLCLISPLEVSGFFGDVVEGVHVTDVNPHEWVEHVLIEL